MVELFGWEFVRKSKILEEPASFTPKEQDDGAMIVSASGSYGTYIDLDGTVRNEAELVTKYREMSLQPELDIAIDEIVNQSISADSEEIVKLNLDKIDISEKLKRTIYSEFNNVLDILGINQNAYDIFRRWYIDGRLYYHVIIDEKNPSDGIREVRYIDPRKIRKIREVTKKRAKGSDNSTGTAVITKTENEYYIFNDKGFNIGNKPVGPSMTGLRIAKDAIVHVTSGLTDTNGSMVLSFLHKAIKPLNQLRTLEDAVVIYRISRAPERRLWYIDVGNLPKMKAEQYVRDIMVKHKNRLIYDAASGEIRDDRKFMTMLEDYWLPRREGGRGTEVTTLPGGQNLGEMEDVNYFKEKLYSSLYVPLNRIDKNNMFNIGSPTEITREELRFGKFISRLRNKFSLLLLKTLEKQLVLKGIVSLEDWELLKYKLKFDFSVDNYFTELKESEILQNRLNIASSLEPFVGRYYSNYWVRKNIFKQSDDDIEEQDEIIEEEGDMMMGPENGGPDITPDENGGGPEPEGAGGGGNSPQGPDDKLIFAKKTYAMLVNKQSKSPQEYSKFQKAAQIIAKSDDPSAKQLIKNKPQ